MPHTRSVRTISALVGTAALIALLSLSAAPAIAADAPWTTPVELADAYGDANATVVASDGAITIVSESALGIVAATSTDAGLTWASVLVGSGGDYAFRPAIGVTSSGLLAASWVESLSDVRTIWVAISADKGATWSTPETLPTVSSEMDDPVVASASASGFTIVWNEGFAKYLSASTDGGVTWSPAQVITQFFNSYRSASLAPVGAGEIVVVFQEFDGDTAQYSIQSERSTDGGVTWGPKVMVGSDWSGSLGNGLYSYGVSPAAGTIVAVWSRGTDTGEALFATTSTDGGASWAPQFDVSVENGSLRYFTVRAVSPTTVGVLWHYESPAGSTLSYSTVTVGAGTATPPVTVATSPSYGFDRLPAFSALGDGASRVMVRLLRLRRNSGIPHLRELRRGCDMVDTRCARDRQQHCRVGCPDNRFWGDFRRTLAPGRIGPERTVSLCIHGDGSDLRGSEPGWPGPGRDRCAHRYDCASRVCHRRAGCGVARGAASLSDIGRLKMRHERMDH